MTTSVNKYIAAAMTIGLVWTQSTTAAHAAVTDYEFQLIQKSVKQGQKVVVFAQRIDMAPDGMEMMAAPIKPLPSAEPGTYKFEAALSMEGRWRLSLVAKVQGETGTLENKLVVEVLP